jgi:hypothetical protein
MSTRQGAENASRWRDGDVVAILPDSVRGARTTLGFDVPATQGPRGLCCVFGGDDKEDFVDAARCRTACQCIRLLPSRFCCAPSIRRSVWPREIGKLR